MSVYLWTDRFERRKVKKRQRKDKENKCKDLTIPGGNCEWAKIIVRELECLHVCASNLPRSITLHTHLHLPFNSDSSDLWSDEENRINVDFISVARLVWGLYCITCALLAHLNFLNFCSLILGVCLFVCMFVWFYFFGCKFISSRWPLAPNHLPLRCTIKWWKSAWLSSTRPGLFVIVCLLFFLQNFFFFF